MNAAARAKSIEAMFEAYAPSDGETNFFTSAYPRATARVRSALDDDNVPLAWTPKCVRWRRRCRTSARGRDADLVSALETEDEFAGAAGGRPLCL